MNPFLSETEYKNEIYCLKDTIEKVLFQKESNNQNHFIQIETPSESNSDDFYQKYYPGQMEPAVSSQYFNQMNRVTPMLNVEHSKAKSSLAKRGSLALRQPPQSNNKEISKSEDFISNENSNMLFMNTKEINDGYCIPNQQFNT